MTDKFMPPRDEDEHLRMQKRKEMEQYADYRNYLSFSMYEQVADESGRVIRENFVDDMAGRDSGGEDRTLSMLRFLRVLRCFICSRAIVIQRLSWCFWMRHFQRWIRSEVRCASSMQERWICS